MARKKRPFLGAVQCEVSSAPFEMAERIYEDKTAELKEPSTYFLLNMNDKIDREVVSAYDVCVMDAGISLWAAGNEEASPHDICRVLNHDANDVTIYEKQAKMVVASLLKLFNSGVTYDWKREPETKKTLEAFDGGGGDHISMTRIYCGGVGLSHERKSGRLKAAYYFGLDTGSLSSFGLLTYSVIANRLLAVDPQLLNIKKVVRGQITDKDLFQKRYGITARTNMQVIREYLLAEVEQEKRMCAANDYNEEMSFAVPWPLFDDATTEETKKHVKSILEYWCAIGYIKGFKPLSPVTWDYGDWQGCPDIWIDIDPETSVEKEKRVVRNMEIQKIREMLQRDMLQKEMVRRANRL